MDVRQLLAATISHHQSGRLDEAEVGYRQLLSLSPDHTDGLNLLGVVASQRGRHAEAVQLIGRAIALRPRPAAQLHCNLGLAYRGLQEHSAAIEQFRRALALKPDYTEAHNNLAAVLLDEGRPDEAEPHCRQAIALRPGSAEAWYALGTSLLKQERLPEAAACYEKAIELKPGYLQAWHNLGVLRMNLDQLDTALVAMSEAVRLKPDRAESYYNLGTLRHERGEYAESQACYRQVLALDPNDVEAQWNIALSQLTLGDFAAGWVGYECRWRRKGNAPREFVEPQWDGGDLTGKTILIYAEQGIGDTIQYARYARMVKARGASTVILECRPSLARLLARMAGVDLIVMDAGSAGVPFDCQVPLVTLPRLFGTTLETIPADIPYLHTDSVLVDAWRERLGPGPNVGLVWRGSPENTRDRYRSMPVETIAPICAIPGINWISLQVDAQPEELEAIARHGPIRDVRTLLDDWTETAALVVNLDLVITVDTSVAHLTGAMGKPAWVLIANPPHWTWMLERDDSPWYPTVRLFRQKTHGDWQGVVGEVRAALHQTDHLPAMDVRRHLAAALSHHQAGRLDEAEAAYRKVLSLSPDHIDGLNLLGVLAAQRGRNGEAVQLIGRAIALQHPAAAQSHCNLGRAYRGLGDHAAAIEQFRRVLALEPDHAEAHHNLADALLEEGRPDEAEAHCRQALALLPSSAEAWCTLGVALQNQKRLADAAEAYEKAIAVAPGYDPAWYNLCSVRLTLDQMDAAQAAMREALRLNPDSRVAHYNLGVFHHERGEYAESLARYQEAIALDPDHVEAHWNIALIRLMHGELAAGWAGYEWRWRRKGNAPPSFAEPPWDGADLAGRTILLHTEQGVGDTIQFARYAPMVKAKGASTVILQCGPGLARLLASIEGIDLIVQDARSAGVRFDCHVPLLTLPRLFGTTLETIPADVPYLHADPVLAGVWRKRLGPGLNVGLVWRGNPVYTRDRRRSIPVETIAPLCAVPGINWVSLQVDLRPEELDVVARHGPIRDVSSLLGDWTETAALVASLDLVIAVDTAVAHLAGAMGKPIWTLIATPPHWAWLLEREDSPWYPTMRLFRQETHGAWDGVIGEVRAALARFGQ